MSARAAKDDEVKTLRLDPFYNKNFKFFASSPFQSHMYLTFVQIMNLLNLTKTLKSWIHIEVNKHYA